MRGGELPELELIAAKTNELYEQLELRCRKFPDPKTAHEHKKLLTRLLHKNRIRDWSVVDRARDQICSDHRWYCQPDDFIRICLEIQSADLGLPSASEALDQALGLSPKNGSQRLPSVIYTIRNMPAHQLDRLRRVDDEQAAKNRWQKYWQKTVEYVMAGGEIKLEPALEERLEKPPLSREESKARLATLKQELSLG